MEVQYEPLHWDDHAKLHFSIDPLEKSITSQHQQWQLQCTTMHTIVILIRGANVSLGELEHQMNLEKSLIEDSLPCISYSFPLTFHFSFFLHTCINFYFIFLNFDTVKGIFLSCSWTPHTHHNSEVSWIWFKVLRMDVSKQGDIYTLVKLSA